MVDHFEEKFKEYANLLVEVGMNLQKGQTVRISSQVACVPNMRWTAGHAMW